MATYTLGNGGNSPAQIFLFDPNWGEFKVSVRHASGFMTRLLQWYDGHREFGRIKRLTVAGVRAGG